MTPDPQQSRSEHWEAMRLWWSSLHIPVGTLLIGSLFLASVVSAVAMMWAYGPTSPIP